jgi:hypothetical protein
MYEVLVAHSPCIHGYHYKLYAERPCQFVDQRRVANGRGIYGNFIGTGFQQRVGVGYFIDAAAYGERYIDLPRDSLNQFDHRFPTLMSCGYIQKNQFIGTLPRIVPGQFDRVAGIAQVDKIDAFYRSAVFYVEAWYNTLR